MNGTNKINERIDNMFLVEIAKINKEEVTVVSSLDVAETFEKHHKDVMESIRAIESNISTAEFSALFNLTTYKASNGKSNPMYVMTKDGFTLLAMGYTGEKAMKFKLAYIKQFNVMEKALQGKLIEREKGIAVRQSLTKALQLSTENERMHGHAYSNYTNCIYKVLFGMTASQLKEKYNVGKNELLRDFFSENQLKAIQSMESMVSGLVDCGWGYDQVKDFIEKTNMTKQLEVAI
jgi:Rha family phage regulatory protein